MLYDSYYVLFILIFKFDKMGLFFCFCEIMLFLNDNLVWMVMGVVLEDLINIMCKEDV